MTLREMFQVINVSASGLPNIGDENSKMQVYAKVLVGKRKKMKTETDEDNETNPAWNCDMSFKLKESEVKQEGAMLVIKLYCKRPRFEEDRYMGEVQKSLCELFNEAAEKYKRRGICGLPLKMAGSETSTGMLRFSYRFNSVKKRVWWKKIFYVSLGFIFVLNT
ncbi:uncharacterized protein LOC132274567 [Cornus florida]|uniref:uncharacterized protein LOC132274567 n=1 Tax=Cornus florida TaxID=4283 RepID=UPI0028989EE4|nr:uncharacterized protein LOC132274567 [Cornus florida]